MPLQDQINPTWPEIIEFEINRRGGEATVGEIVALMMELGWSEPSVEKRAYRAGLLPTNHG